MPKPTRSRSIIASMAFIIANRYLPSGSASKSRRLKPSGRRRVMPAPKVSVILGSYNRLRFLKSTIASVRGNGISSPSEIIVVDGGSTDGSLEWLARQKDIILIVQHNRRVVDGVPLKGRNW